MSIEEDVRVLREALAAGEITKGDYSIRTSRNCIDEYDSYLEPLGLFLHEGIRDGDCAVMAAATPDRIARLLSALEECGRDAEGQKWIDDFYTAKGYYPSLMQVWSAALAAQPAAQQAEPAGTIDHVEWSATKEQWRHTVWTDNKITFGTKLYTTPQPAQQARKPMPEVIDWAVSKWQAEVANRPLVNIHRGRLDRVWREVITFAGGDAVALIGFDHDTIIESMQVHHGIQEGATPQADQREGATRD